MSKNLQQILKSKKMRLTKARLMIFNILNQSDCSLSAKEIFEKTREFSDIKTDQVSVYRNLSLFKNLGLAHRLQNGKYSLCRQEHKHQYKQLHIIANCYYCGKAYEIRKHTKKLCELAKKFKNFVKSFGSFNNLTMGGICKSCQESGVLDQEG